MKLRWPLRRHGLTLKLILIYLGMILLGVVLVGASMRYAFRDNYRDTVKPHLDLYIEYVRNDLGEPPSRERALALTKSIPVQIHFLNNKEHWSTDGSPVPSLDDLHYWRRGRSHDAPIKFGHLGGDDIAVIETATHKILFVSPDDDDEWRPVMVLPLLIVVAMFAALYYLTRRLFAPLHDIRNAVNQFGDGNLEQRVHVNRKDELGEVAQSFNHMADHIQQMLESKRQLLLAISHELRSPLTRAKLATAMLEDETQRGEIEDELVEMESLVAELLETERFNAGHNVLNRQDVDISTLLQNTADAVDLPIQTQLPSEPIHLDVDETRLRLVIKNLLENACKYTPSNKPPPTLQLARRGEKVSIVVNDNGPGIAPEHLPHISEPFYRVDPARQRATGGYGLGLYLSRVIVEAHGGSLTIESEVGNGTTVSILLPGGGA